MDGISHDFIWRRLDIPSLEYCTVEFSPRLQMRGQVVAELNSHPVCASYVLHCDADGTTEECAVTLESQGVVKHLTIARGGDGRWWRDGCELPEFQGVRDIDLGVTPATNTLPIRRLKLSPGDSARLVAVWVKFPELAVLPLEQVYARLDAHTYRYQSFASGYEAVLTVDGDGLVTRYANVWERLRRKLF